MQLILKKMEMTSKGTIELSMVGLYTDAGDYVRWLKLEEAMEMLVDAKVTVKTKPTPLFDIDMDKVVKVRALNG